MTSVVQEKLGYAEIEARKRRERLLRLKRKARGELDHDEEEKLESKDEDDVTMSGTEDPIEETNAKKGLDELDLSNLAPRKIDWDLKRGIAKSLEILQDRTNEVITEIVRERLEETEGD